MVKASDIKAAYIQTSGRGDIADGKVILAYDTNTGEKVYRIEYDTVPGPDGLRTMVTDNVGDSVSLESGKYEKAPEFVIKQARQTFSNYYHESNQGKGATSEGRVTFTGAAGLNDGWLPDKDI
jgi:hypothetical protein